jgi:hypothetical protein
MRYLFIILVSILLTRKIVTTHIILAQNSRKNKADFEYIRNVFSILILSSLTRKIAKTHVILAQDFRENNVESRYIGLYLQFRF